jgi:hypothetical protein
MDESLAPAVTHQPLPSERADQRYNHITVRLQYQHFGQWRFAQAREWSETGFNFFCEDALECATLPLKRGLSHFDGQIVWRSRPADEQAMLGTLINELIYKRAQQTVNDAALQARLLRLIRVDGMVPEKRRILGSLGLVLSDDKLAALLATRQRERPLFHYGVRVVSDLWQAHTAQALSLSSVVLSMTQWSQTLKQLVPGKKRPAP